MVEWVSVWVGWFFFNPFLFFLVVVVEEKIRGVYLVLPSFFFPFRSSLVPLKGLPSFTGFCFTGFV